MPLSVMNIASYKNLRRLTQALFSNLFLSSVEFQHQLYQETLCGKFMFFFQASVSSLRFSEYMVPRITKLKRL